jgi:putative membrane protein
MVYWLVKWLVSAILLLVVSKVVPGFDVASFGSALAAALLIGIVNATLGLFLKIVTFPLTLITFGLFMLVINALMILLVSSVVRGFVVRGFAPAFWGALLLALLGMLTRWWFTAA